jgi:BMFP domain-containing protein YqiC
METKMETLENRINVLENMFKMQSRIDALEHRLSALENQRLNNNLFSFPRTVSSHGPEFMQQCPTSTLFRQ